MRKKESWMGKGAIVKLSLNEGIITSLTTARVEVKEMVMTIWVRPNGVMKSFPFNPNDIKFTGKYASWFQRTVGVL